MSILGFSVPIEIFRSSDSSFYEAPRFVTHIDDPAIAALTKFYSEVLPPSNTPGVAILDMCSSWVRHAFTVSPDIKCICLLCHNLFFLLSRSAITLKDINKTA